MTNQPDNAANILEQIRKLSREFGKQISQGKSPRIQEFLSQISTEGRADLFANLIAAETNFRRSQGESPTSDEYLKRFPQYKKQVRRAFFEPTMGSVDSSSSTDGDDQTASLRRPGQNADALEPTFELPDANRLGDYELIRKLGQGGMGIVYEAQHTKTNNRVALKTLPTGGDGQQVNADKLYRFRKEFRRLSEINHANLVGMQSLEVDGERWFFTMDLIDGEDFLSYVRPDDQLDEDRLRSCLKQLAVGVIELHCRGIIHRDLKPSNVLVSVDGRVKILDFGLAAELQKATDVTQTRTGLFAGTPRYAAPEQVFGERTEASDWYAFGTMLYETLTGDAPYHGKNQADLLRLKQEQDVPRLSDRDDLPSDLAELSDGLVHREPGLRLTADAVGELLGLDQETRLSGGTTRDTQGSTGSIADADAELGDLEDEEITLIGREQQLAQLESIRQDFSERQQPAVVWITGLSGEGKSSLVQKFLRPIRRRDEWVVMSGRCYDRELVPFKVIDSSIDPLVRFLRSLTENEVESLLPDDIEMLGRLFPLLRRVNAIDRRCRRIVDQRDDQQVRNLAFAALKDLLVAIGEKLPVVWFVDDLQWGDADSAQMLLKMLAPPNPPRLMFIGSLRSDEIGDSPFLKSWQSGSADSRESIRFDEIQVEPLTEPQCLEFLLVRGMNATASLRAQVAELYRESRGNPYFLEQLLETYDEQAQEFESVPLQLMIRGRLAQSPERAKEVLEWIAVLGRAATVSEINALTGSSVDVMAIITHMRSERLVRLMGDRGEPKVDTYHDKIRETVLQELTVDQRRQLHLKIAELIEQRSRFDSNDQEAGDRLPEQVFDLARHFLEAGDGRAFAYQLLAGQAALSAFALDTALEHFRAAEQVCPADASRSHQFDLHFGLATTLNACGQLLLARAEFDVAIELASSNIERAKCLAPLSEISFRQSDYEGSWRYLSSALAELGERLPKTLVGRLMKLIPCMIQIHLLPSWVSIRRRENEVRTDLTSKIYLNQNSVIGQRDVSLYLFGNIRGCALAKYTDDDRGKAEAYSSYAYTLSLIGLSMVARAMIKHSRHIAAEEFASGRHQGWVAATYYNLGELETARPMIERAVQSVSREADYIEWSAQHFLWHLWAIRGVPLKIIQHATNEGRIASFADDKMVRSYSKYGMAEGLAKQGDTEEAAELVGEAVEDLSAAKSVFLPVGLIQSAKVRIQAGRYQEARQDLAAALRDIPKLRYSELTVDAFALWVEAVLGVNWLNAIREHGTGERVRLAWAIRLARFSGFLFPAHRPGPRRMKGRLLACRGKIKSARKNFDRAIAAAAAVGADYERARTLIDKSRLGHRDWQNERTEGLELLESLGCVLPDAELEALHIDRQKHHGRAKAARERIRAKHDLPAFDLQAAKRQLGLSDVAVDRPTGEQT